MSGQLHSWAALLQGEKLRVATECEPGWDPELRGTVQ
jgi:hypothetical protein